MSQSVRLRLLLAAPAVQHTYTKVFTSNSLQGGVDLLMATPWPCDNIHGVCIHHTGSPTHGRPKKPMGSWRAPQVGPMGWARTQLKGPTRQPKTQTSHYTWGPMGLNGPWVLGFWAGFSGPNWQWQKYPRFV